ncbi:MAG: carbon monoxide dehydrogenase subunit G [Boseongicola sp.]|nr:carbon monoxide dehydrogenase subunit G [Boseongicola sp.]
MKMVEERVIAVPPDIVWGSILDVEVLKKCIPGCEELTGNLDDGFEAVVVQKVGPVKATFRGAVFLRDIDPGRSCRLEGEGKGGAAGFAKGGALVQLEAEGDGTRLSYEVEAKIGGKLAQLGSRLIDSFAKKLADRFFSRFEETVLERVQS